MGLLAVFCLLWDVALTIVATTFTHHDKKLDDSLVFDLNRVHENCFIRALHHFYLLFLLFCLRLKVLVDQWLLWLLLLFLLRIVSPGFLFVLVVVQVVHIQR